MKEGPFTPATSNAPLRAGKGYLYEGGIRVPLVIRWPGRIPAGSICQATVSSIDFFPTLIELAGIQRRPSQILDGESLSPLLKQSGELKRDALFWHYPHYSNQGGKPGSAIRQGDFKLIEFFEDGNLELYNLRDDLSETRDLASQLPDKVRALHRRLTDWRTSVDAQMMKANPNFKTLNTSR